MTVGHVRSLLHLLAPVLLGALLGGCGMNAEARCFPADTTLPDATLLRGAAVGQSVRALGEALLAGDVARARGLLAGDRALARATIDPRHDMLSFAVAGCAPDAIGLLLEAGALADGADGKGYPLRLALHADDPALAHRLLMGGASATPAAAPLAPLREAIARNSLGAVTMLLDFRADPDVMGAAGKRPLHVALDMDRYRIAELLLDRGADPFAIDATGANLGSSLAVPMQTESRDDAQARDRLRAKLPALGWPDPAPDPRAVRRLALDDAWPPAGAKGARRVPPNVLEAIAAGARGGSPEH